MPILLVTEVKTSQNALRRLRVSLGYFYFMNCTKKNEIIENGELSFRVGRYKGEQVVSLKSFVALEDILKSSI